MDSPLVVKTLGSSWQTNWIALEVQISIGSIPFPFTLIALKSDDLDVILGMDWLVKYQANLCQDCHSDPPNLRASALLVPFIRNSIRCRSSLSGDQSILYGRYHPT